MSSISPVLSSSVIKAIASPLFVFFMLRPVTFPTNATHCDSTYSSVGLVSSKAASTDAMLTAPTSFSFSEYSSVI